MTGGIPQNLEATLGILGDGEADERTEPYKICASCEMLTIEVGQEAETEHLTSVFSFTTSLLHNHR